MKRCSPACITCCLVIAPRWRSTHVRPDATGRLRAAPVVRTEARAVQRILRRCGRGVSTAVVGFSAAAAARRCAGRLLPVRRHRFVLDRLPDQPRAEKPGRRGRQKTFSARADEAAFDESPWIAEVVKATGVDARFVDAVRRAAANGGRRSWRGTRMSRSRRPASSPSGACTGWCRRPA